MPKSKRARIVHTSAVQKKPAKERSAALYTEIQTAASAHAHIFVLRVANMRNTFLQEVRAHFKPDSRLFFGKTKVMAKALGSGEESEAMPGLAGLAPYLKGSVGLLFTSRAKEEVVEFFDGYAEMDFARTGAVSTLTFTVPAGVVYSTGGAQPAEDDVAMPHSQEVTVRKWGMPTKLEKGKVMLDSDYVVCEEGKTMNSHQTALLKLFGVPMAEFKVSVLAHWNAATGAVEVVDEGAANEVDGMDEDE